MPKSDPQIGVSVETGDRVVGAGAKDADGKYDVPLVDNDGHLQVDVLSGGGGGTQYDDGDAVPTPLTGTVALGTDGTNLQAIKTDSDGNAQVDVLTIAAGNNNIGDVDVASIAAGDNNIGNVDLASSIPAGTNNIGDVDVLTIPGIVGTIADDSTTPGNPVMVGGFAISTDGTDPGSVAEADVARFRTDLNRRLLVNTVHPRFGHKHLDGTAAYTDESLVADPGDGFQIIITHITFSSGEAVAINFFLEEGSTKIFGPIYLEGVAGRGYVSGPIHLPVTASTAVTLTTSAANDQCFEMDYFIQAV